MIEDVYEPLAKYRDEFKNKFTVLAQKKFQALVQESGVDINANRKQVGIVKNLEASLSSEQTKLSIIRFFMILGYIGIVAGVILAIVYSSEQTSGCFAGGIIGAIISLLIAILFTILFCKAKDVVNNLKGKVYDAKQIAWTQMRLLNRLFTWDITTSLIQSTVPRLAFDPFFTARRLADLKRLYDWDDSFNEGRSIMFAQSGVINGNPFLFGEYLEMEWGTETYRGYLDIEWYETVTDSEGRRRRELRHETLTATVDKPIPVYSKEKILLYGNDAAPNLSFTRNPSSLSGAQDGFITSIRKKWHLNKLKKHSENLDDDSDYTLMGNHEFEMLFDTRDRDNEVEYRLLFTALAQIQMLALLKDKEVGFGDDFSFIKRGKMNAIMAEHLNEGTLDTDPKVFYDWDIDHSYHNFMTFNERYFKDVYFALAPLLAIPLYQQTRTHEDIWRGIVDTDSASFWEHEATANYYGDGYFKHPDCITKNILKTRETGRSEGVSRIEVTAYGFGGNEQVEYIEKYGGDGKYHRVPVKWIEYYPVENTKELVISEGETTTPEFADRYESAAKAVLRRSVYSFLS